MTSRHISLSAALTALFLLPGCAGAAPPAEAPACVSSDAGLPDALRGWTSPVEAVSLRDAGAQDTAPLAMGVAYDAALLPVTEVTLAHPPEKPAGEDRHAGLFAFETGAPGAYSILLGAPGWIDVVTDGALNTSIAHGHGPDCSTIRKSVTFDLPAGRHLLQISGSEAAETRLMIVPGE